MTTNPSIPQTPPSVRYAEASKILTQLKEDVKKYGTLEAPDETQQKTINSQFESFKNGIASQFPTEVSTTLFTKMNRVYDKFDRITTKVELVAVMKQIQEFNEGKNTNAPNPEQLKDLLNSPNISPKYVEVLLIATEKLAKTADPKSETNNNSNPLIDFTPPSSPKPAHKPTSPSTDSDIAKLFETPTKDPNPSVIIDVKSASSEPTPPDSPTSTHSKSSESSKSEETKAADTTPTPIVTHTLSTVVSGGGGAPSPEHTPPASPKPTHSSSSGTPEPEEHNLNASPDGKKGDQPEIATTTTGTDTPSLDITPPASPKTPHVTVSTYSDTTNPDESKKGEDKSPAVPVIDLKTSQDLEQTPDVDSVSQNSGSSQEDSQDVPNTSQNPAQGNVFAQQETKSTEFDVAVSHSEGVPPLDTTSSEGKTETVSSQENNNNSIQTQNTPTVPNLDIMYNNIRDTIAQRKKEFHSNITKFGEDLAQGGMPNLAHLVFGQAYFFAKQIGWNVNFKDPGEEYVKINLFTADQLNTIFDRANALFFLESMNSVLSKNPTIIAEVMNDCEKYSLSTANNIYGATWKYATETEKKQVPDFGKHAFKGTEGQQGQALYPISLETKQAAVKAVINDCKRTWNNN